jgi:hypothetical protein
VDFAAAIFSIAFEGGCLSQRHSIRRKCIEPFGVSPFESRVLVDADRVLAKSLNLIPFPYGGVCDRSQTIQSSSGVSFISRID